MTLIKYRWKILGIDDGTIASSFAWPGCGMEDRTQMAVGSGLDAEEASANAIERLFHFTCTEWGPGELVEYELDSEEVDEAYDAIDVLNPNDYETVQNVLDREGDEMDPVESALRFWVCIDVELRDLPETGTCPNCATKVRFARCRNELAHLSCGCLIEPKLWVLNSKNSQRKD